VGGQLRSPALLDVAVAAAGLLDRLLHVTVALEVALASAAGLEEEEVLVVMTRSLYDTLVTFPRHRAALYVTLLCSLRQVDAEEEEEDGAMALDGDPDDDTSDGNTAAHRATVQRSALRSLRKCRREGAAALSRACLQLLRRNWADCVTKRRYAARDVGCFVRLSMHWAPLCLAMVQVRDLAPHAPP